MKNQYWIIPTTLLKSVQQRGTTDSPYPHKNVHWRLSVDEKTAIVQGEFDEETIKWLEKQVNTSKIGDYINGKAESKVSDYIKENKIDWEIELTL